MEKIIAAVLEELNYSYAQSGKSIATETAVSIARRMSDDLHFNDETEVREAFRRAREIQDIPTQRTLSEAIKNHRAEHCTPAIENNGNTLKIARSSVSAWLPDNPVIRKVNIMEAVKNFCIAQGEKMYDRLCELSVRSNGDYVFENKRREFVREKINNVVYLYSKYLRLTPMYATFPKDVETNDPRMKPATVQDFRWFLAMEAEAHT